MVRVVYLRQLSKLQDKFPAMGETSDSGEHNEKEESSWPQTKACGSPKPRKKDEGTNKVADKGAANNKKKAELETKIRDRVATEAKAFDVVNRLIEPNITQEYLLEALQLIDHSGYGDVVEERAITHVCGYPVCSNRLSQVAKKKYHISTRTNTVYDITERKKFCSNECFRSSQYLESQVPQTPVWSRRDAPQVTFQLLQAKSKESLEGEAVIGSNMFSLEQEVMQQKRMDQKAQEASTAGKTNAATRESLEESLRLSEELLSLSTEADLESMLGGLSLGAQAGTSQEKDRPGTEGPGHSSPAVGEESKSVPEGRGGGGDMSETRAGGLTSLENVPDKSRDGSSDNETKRLESLKNCPAGSSKGGDVSVTGTDAERLGSDMSSLNLQDKVTVQGATNSDDEERGRGCTHHQQLQEGDSASNHHENSKDTATGQQPGESKSAYLMRLLNKRQNLLSKVADIQPDAKMCPQNLHSEHQPSVEEKASEQKDDKVGVSGIATEESVRPCSGEHAKKKGNPEKMSGSSLSPSLGKFNSTDKANTPGNSRPTPPEKATKPAATKLSHPKSPSQPKVSPVDFVCQLVSQWVTLETLTYLGMGPAGEAEGGVGGLSDAFHKDPEIQKKYQDLCQRLAGQEKDFEELLGEDEVDGEKTSSRKPLPHFEELKKQNVEYQERVDKFFKGPSTTQKKKMTVKQGDEGDSEDIPEENTRSVFLPVVDSHNQLLIRRRIALERLDSTMPSLLPPLGLSPQDVSGHVRELVFTFSLSSKNIVLKPAEWSLVGIILLRVLALKSQTVAAAFQSESRCTLLNMVLKRFGHSTTTLGQLVQETLSQCKQHLQASTLD